MSSKPHRPQESARRSDELACAYCGRPAAAMHAFPSFEHPRRVVLVCANHRAEGERALLRELGTGAGTAARAAREDRLERLARALTIGGYAFVAVAVVLAIAVVLIRLF